MNFVDEYAKKMKVHRYWLYLPEQCFDSEEDARQFAAEINLLADKCVDKEAHGTG